MPLVKKINPDWRPSEKPGLQVGEIIDMTNPTSLVNFGMAVYVDAQGNELKREKTFQCSICTKWFEDPYLQARHILNDHQTGKKEVNIQPEMVNVGALTNTTIPSSSQPKAFKDMTDAEKKEFRVNNLKKAREAKKIADEEKLNSEAIKAVIAAKKNG